MKLTRTLSVTVFAIACFVVAGAAAPSKDFRSVILHYNASLAGSQLASGKYKVEWQTHSPEATVTFFQGSKVVATVEGKVVDRGKRYPSDEVMYDEIAGGGRVIRELRFRGSSEVVEFNP